MADTPVDDVDTIAALPADVPSLPARTRHFLSLATQSPPLDGQPLPTFDELDLSPAAIEPLLATGGHVPPWWDTARGAISLQRLQMPGVRLRLARLPGSDLQDANLEGGALGEIQLDGALLNRINLRDADLLGAHLEGATLDEARLQGTLLEEAHLNGASLRFATLDGAVLEQAQMRGADLWGATGRDTQCAQADLSGAILREASFPGMQGKQLVLRGADLSNTDLTGATLTGADLRETNLHQTCLRGAKLDEARLQNLVFYGCDITHVHLANAWLDRTMLRQEQLGGAIGEEIEGDYAAAVQGYGALERNFSGIGDLPATTWAYRKRRRMQRKAHWQNAQAAAREKRWGAASAHALRSLTDQGVEWLCDYGESIPRVLLTLALVYLGFTLLYGVTGSVVRVEQGASGPQQVVTREFTDLATFSLLAISTSGSPVVRLLPSHEWVHLLTASEALLGIFLTGLLGYVVGNKIRR